MSLPREDQILLQDTLVSLSLDDRLIDEIMSMLDEQRVELLDRPLPDIQESWFGDSRTGGYRLATNAMQASTVVADSLAEMLMGLEQYNELLRTFANDMRATDDNIGVSMTKFENAVACTDGVPATTCTPPTENP
ncbi:hypothetical protein [Nocardioides sp.]|uniref:hypothetical protein n=1 Tax=Nocardioides sp. TaxID=35761 RepID=UPI002D7F9FD6|nr:hypothetical protein [Nocardioides sp.]